jgi:penicillin-binding protein 1A
VAASSLGRPIGGKTGTTNEYRSAWFVGFSPDLVVGVFVGFDDNRSLGQSETGAVAALPIFIDFMKEALKDTPPREFKPPKTARFAYVNGIREAFRPGTEPRTVAPTVTRGPRPYMEAWGGAPGPVTPAPPPQPKQAPADLNGLY